MSPPKRILPALPQPIDEMNGQTLSSILVGIGKDLGIDWKGDQPKVVAKKSAFRSSWRNSKTVQRSVSINYFVYS